MDKVKVYNDLQNMCKDVLLNEYMNKHTSFKTGGPADVLAKPSSVEEIKNIILYCKQNHIPYYVIGNGTNLLVKDGGIRGVVIKISYNMNNFEIKDDRIIADAGASIIAISQAAYKNELSGLEFACGIPGTVGGVVRMNAGAFKGEMSDIVETTTYIDDDGNIVTIDNNEHKFTYRNSIFGNNSYIILQSTFILKKGNSNEIKEKMDYNTKIRKEKQPLGTYNAGSSFKRLDGYFPGKLIEDSGLKGYTIGGAEVSTVHANFLVNNGNATSKDILQLFDYVKNTVFEKYNVVLEPEIQILGED